MTTTEEGTTMTTTTVDTQTTRAAAHVAAVPLPDGRWAHYDAGTRHWYSVTTDELAALCDWLDAPDPAMRRDAYSHWCAGTSAVEMPAGWTPDDAPGRPDHA